MGQLEKYGLYVLCLVIFLILGVTIWGGGDTPPVRVPVQPIRADVSAPQQPTGNLAQLAEDIFRQPAPEPVRPAPTPTPVPTPAVTDAGGATAMPASLSPSPTPAPAIVAAPAAYKVQKGDTFATIARTKLGKESLWTEIQRLNPAVQPSKLREGQELKLPTATPTPAPSKPALDKPLAMPADGMRDYVVRKGDSYEKIAINQLGGRKRTSDVIAANPGVPPEKLRAGMTIKLPKK
jgi:LysM repeat protein